MILAVINHKGGTGKTTTAVNLAAGLATRGRFFNRVLLADLDAQNSATRSVGFQPDPPTMADVLLDGQPIRAAIRPTSTEGLDIIPGGMALADVDMVFGSSADRETRLAKALHLIRGQYGLIVLDCPPSMSLLTVQALRAADAYIVPVVPQYLALEGLANLTATLDRLQCKAALLGIVLTMVDRRLRSAADIAAIVRQHYGKAVFPAEIPANVRLSEAPSFGQTVFQYDPRSRGALAYADLADQVIKRTRHNQLSM